jgi:hypothetical protein
LQADPRFQTPRVLPRKGHRLDPAQPEIQYPKPPYWYVLDVTRARHSGAGVEELIRATAFRDGADWPISMEQERGATGKLLIQTYQKNVLPEFTVHRFWAKGSKEDRAAIVSGRAGEADTSWSRVTTSRPFLDELGLFGIKGFTMTKWTPSPVPISKSTGWISSVALPRPRNTDPPLTASP